MLYKISLLLSLLTEILPLCTADQKINISHSEKWTGHLNSRTLKDTPKTIVVIYKTYIFILGDMIRTGADSEVNGAYIVLGQK